MVGKVTKNLSFFDITKLIVERTESMVMGLAVREGWLLFVSRVFYHPYRYMKVGLSELSRPASVWSFMAFVVLLACSFLLSKFEAPVEYRAVIMNFTMIPPFLLVIFAMPSTYMCNGVKSEVVNKVVSELRAAGISDSDSVDLFENNVEKFSNRVESRISFYRWTVGGFWALYLVFFNLDMRMASSQNFMIAAEKIRDNLFSMAFTILAVFACIISILAYKRASELLFTTIEIGCTEYKYQLLQLKLEKERTEELGKFKNAYKVVVAQDVG